MNYKNLLLNGLIVCSVSPCFAAQEAPQIEWVKHDAPEDLESGQLYNSKTLNMGNVVRNIALSSDKRLLSVDGTEHLSIVDMKTGRNIYGRVGVFNLAWMHNVPCIVAVLGQKMGIINPLSGGMVQEFEDYKFFGSKSIAISLDDTKIVLGSSNKAVMIRDISLGKCVQTFEGHSDWVRSVTISLDGRTVVSGSDDTTVKVWDVRLGKWVKTFHGHNGEVYSVAMSSNGTEIASGSKDETVKVWDIRSNFFSSSPFFGKYKPKTLKDHNGEVYSIAMNYNGTEIISGSKNKTVKIWNVNSKECTQTLRGHDSNVNSVAMNYNGTEIISGSWDKTVKVWEQKK